MIIPINKEAYGFEDAEDYFRSDWQLKPTLLRFIISSDVYSRLSEFYEWSNYGDDRLAPAYLKGVRLTEYTIHDCCFHPLFDQYLECGFTSAAEIADFLAKFKEFVKCE